jgi:hypothetical protein
MDFKAYNIYHQILNKKSLLIFVLGPVENAINNFGVGEWGKYYHCC